MKSGAGPNPATSFRRSGAASRVSRSRKPCFRPSVLVHVGFFLFLGIATMSFGLEKRFNNESVTGK
jgi:hypothetical protein